MDIDEEKDKEKTSVSDEEFDIGSYFTPKDIVTAAEVEQKADKKEMEILDKDLIPYFELNCKDLYDNNELLDDDKEVDDDEYSHMPPEEHTRPEEHKR